ncbi:hypothetical protein LEP1GSC131_1514 [Leptospira kirschneri str. 200802841]|uniref:Uncharacterized protein n=1 Tax=Leptospira kirschneri str. 200802841 TaxID=1193047 RepID=A0A828Y9M0_9LEPT|nr:hypothetical protein LEP1GSC131_1514 [Leptospira kirschneri str. 200802841]
MATWLVNPMLPPGPLVIFKGLMRAVEIGFMFKLLTKA